jgi:hypothetical protein
MEKKSILNLENTSCRSLETFHVPVSVCNFGIQVYTFESFKESVSGYNYSALVTDEQRGVDNWRNHTDGGKLKLPDRNTFQFLFVHYT